MTQTKLAQEVRTRIQETKKMEEVFSKEAIAALLLADKYQAVVPQDYLLPINELAGFSTAKSKQK